MSKIEKALEKATKMREQQKKESDKAESHRSEEHSAVVNKSRKSLFSGVSLIILIVALTGAFLYLRRTESNKVERPDKTAELQSSVKDNKWINTIKFRGTNCKIEVTRLTGNLLKDSLGAAGITYKEQSENAFYSIQLSAINDCLPEESTESVYDYVSFIKNGKHIKPRELHVLHDMKKVIYKQKVCGGKTGIVFFRFFIACPKEMNPEGLLISGEELLF